MLTLCQLKWKQMRSIYDTMTTATAYLITVPTTTTVAKEYLPSMENMSSSSLSLSWCLSLKTVD